MRINRKVIALLFIGVLSLCLLACQQDKKKSGDKTTKQTEENKVVEGLVMTYGEEEIIFVDPSVNSLFYAAMPDNEIYDKNGEKITIEELGDGDKLAFYGNGIVMESYPPQYPQITKVVRQKKGTKEDIASYQELLDEFYQEPDPMEVPFLNIEYRTQNAIVSALTGQLSYTWTAENKDGEEETVTACGLHILEAQGMERQNFDTDTKEVTLHFSKSPNEVKVTRWEKGSEIGDAEKGEVLNVRLEKKEAVLENPKTASVYQVEAVFKQGNVVYGFVVE